MAATSEQLIAGADVPASADATWDAIKDFGNVMELIGAPITKCEASGEPNSVGSKRVLDVGKGDYTEELLVWDSGARKFQYSIVDPSASGFPWTAYWAEWRIVPDGDDKCRFEFEAHWEPAEGQADACKGMLEGLSAHFCARVVAAAAPGSAPDAVEDAPPAEE